MLKGSLCDPSRVDSSATTYPVALPYSRLMAENRLRKPKHKEKIVHGVAHWGLGVNQSENRLQPCLIGI